MPRNLIFIWPLVFLSLAGCGNYPENSGNGTGLPEGGSGYLQEGENLGWGFSEMEITDQEALDAVRKRMTSTCRRTTAERSQPLVRSLERQLRMAIWSANSCVTVSDCKRVKDYFGECCGSPPSINKNADMKEIENLIAQLNGLVTEGTDRILCTADIRYMRDFTFCHKGKCI